MGKRIGFGGVSSSGPGLRVPFEVWNALGLDHPDAVVEFVEHDGEIVLRPRVAVHPDDAWFWEEGQQRAEREAEAELAAGEVSDPMTGEEFLAHLKRLTGEAT